jgi:SAM-dependent methyltransferase
LNCNERSFPEIKFGGFANNDGTIAFYLHVNALLSPASVVLDVGCGRGEYRDDPVAIRQELRILSGKVDRVIGLDVDPAAADNPFLQEFRLLPDPSAPWPVGAESVDMVLSDWTLEHVADPRSFFGEASRVLKKGGFLCARTTNAWGYVALMARLIPEKYHSRIVRGVQETRKEEDIFPAHYACNTIPLLKRMLNHYWLSGIVIGFPGTPAYLHFSCFAYRLGVIYEKFAPPSLRHTLMVFARKT